MSTNTTAIENGKIKWTLFDSKNNQYDWAIPIHTQHEEYHQKWHKNVQSVNPHDKVDL